VDEGRQEGRAGRHEGGRGRQPLRDGPGGVAVFAPDGTHLGTIANDEPTANCGWGDDGSTLYVTRNKCLARIKTTTKGK